MKLIFTALFVVVATIAFSQTIYRVNNKPGVTGTNIYTTIQAAHDAASTGDIIYVEPSTNSYGTLLCTKGVKVYGNGYFLDVNPQLQSAAQSSPVGDIEINSASANGAEFYGISCGYIKIAAASNIKIKRCYPTTIQIWNGYTSGLGGGVVSPVDVTSLEIAQNYIGGSINSYPSVNRSITNLLVENNYVSGVVYLYAAGTTNASFNNVIVRNNVLNSEVGIENGIFENNIWNYTSGGIIDAIVSGNYALNCTVNNNVSKGDILPAGNGNQTNLINLTLEFINTGSNDAKWLLKNNSPLKTAGNGGIEVGMFGGSNPYVISGIPSIPNFTKMQNTGTGSSTTPLSVTISTKSNN
jgi:hypothetical protein